MGRRPPMSEVTKKEMLEALDDAYMRLQLDPWCEQAKSLGAIRRLIENKKVSKKQLSIWADRIMSEVEIVGYVPEWMLRDIFETLGHEVEEKEK
jgi:hypothetical protein